MSKAIGIGGVFLHFNGESKEVFAWYEKYLGLEFSAYGSGFLSGEQLMVLTFKRDDNPNMPYLNLRVDNIQEIIDLLKKDQIEILSDINTYEYGKFATIKDPFNNVIELWEANPKEYRKLVEEEIKNYKIHKSPKV